MSPSQPEPWRHRGYLPHFDGPGKTQMVSFRLHDALPTRLLAPLRDDLRATDAATVFGVRERCLDEGHGSCWLRRPEIAQAVEDCLLYFHERQYALSAWVIMPNHVHALVRVFENRRLSDTVKSWKSNSARNANRLLERTGRFWYPDYFDRYMRDEAHELRATRYIEENPVKAGLVTAPHMWRFSSAWHKRRF